MRTGFLTIFSTLGVCSISVPWMGCSASKEPPEIESLVKESGHERVAAAPIRSHSGDSVGPRLFSLVPLDSQCIWMVQDITTGQEQQVYSTETCPKQVIWQGGRVYYTQGRNLFSVTDVDDPPTPLGAPMDDRCQDWGIPLMNEGTLEWACGMVAHGGEEGIYCVGHDCYPEEAFIPSWGSPYIARVYRLEGDQWSKVRTVTTCSEADGCWGLVTATPPPSDDWNHLTQISDRQTAAGEQCGPDIETGQDARPDFTHSSFVRSLFGLSATPEQDDGSTCVHALQMSPSDWLVFPVTWGDTAHATTPVYRCSENKDECTRPEELSDLPTSFTDQLSIRPISEPTKELAYVIVSPEYPDSESHEAQVFGGMGAASVAQFPEVSAIIWLDGFAAPFD